jgi:hypothetical protein
MLLRHALAPKYFAAKFAHRQQQLLCPVVTICHNSPMWSNYLSSLRTPVSTNHVWTKLSASRHSGNCLTEIGECQISVQSNPAARPTSTKGNRSRILLLNRFSNCHAATLSNFGELSACGPEYAKSPQLFHPCILPTLVFAFFFSRRSVLFHTDLAE